MEVVEPPECPVCLQAYVAVTTIPRVLSCGHTTCEDCLKQLPNPFPNTLRCTVCTLLVKFSNSPSSLPKNLDLLHISSLLQGQPTKGKHVLSLPNGEKTDDKSLALPLIPKPWSYEFYCKWKNWFLPEHLIVMEKTGGLQNDCGMLHGEVLKSFEGNLVMGCVMRQGEMVGLVKVGIFMMDDATSKLFEYSYELRILNVLFAMKEKERTELEFVLNSNSSLINSGKVYGLWYDRNHTCVYLVFEKFDSPNLLKDLFNEMDKEDPLSTDQMVAFGIFGMEMCEILSCLHLQGLVVGTLGVNCFGFKQFGRVYFDFGEVINIGRRLNFVVPKVRKELKICLKDTLLDGISVFISPEILSQFLANKGFQLDCEKWRSEDTSASDVWSLASLLVWLIVGTSFSEEIKTLLLRFFEAANDERILDYSELYKTWMHESVALLRRRMGPECTNLQEVLSRCLEFDPTNRPVVTDLWLCLRELVIKPQYDTGVNLKLEAKEEFRHCLVLGELCQLVEETSKKQSDVHGENEKASVNQDGELIGDVGEGVSRGHIKCIEMKGHLDCVTGLAIGGGFLFSSSYDKMVCVWSLQDFALVHCFKGHEHRVMGVVFVNGEAPLCISGDSEGVICLWGVNPPLGETPMKKLEEGKDWRYSGIHALAVSGSEILYTGSGDRLVKAWSLQDYTLLCSLSGHKSVVSSLVVCNGVLYSGSWDGTVRLWSLSDHSSLAVLGEDRSGNMASATSLFAECDLLFVGHENGCVKTWNNDVLLKSTQTHSGSVLSVCKKEKWLFSGGWDKKISVHEISEDRNGMDSILTGTIDCGSVITALLYWEGKLLVGLSDRTIQVYYGVE